MSVSHLKYPRLVDPIVASIVSNTLVRYSRVVELTEVVHMCRVALHRFDYVTRGWRRLLTRYRRMRHGATRDDLLETLGDALYDAYNVYGKAPLLKKAISAYRQALRLRPRGHPRRALSLANLGVAVQAFYETQNMDVTGLHRSIQLHREALDLRPPGHPSRPASLGHLSNALQSSFKQTGRIHHLAESKNRLREVMKFAPSDHRDRDGILNDLAHILRISFEQEGSQSSLEEAVVMYREALRIRLIEHAAPSVSLVDLASMPTRDSKEQSARSPLVEAVALLRATLNLCPPGHVARALVLSHLAHTLRLSFKQHGGRETIEESVFVHRQAVELCPPGSLHRDTFVEDLAITLSIFHDHFDNSDSLAEAIRLQRETLLLRPPGHAARHDSLCSLGVWLWRWAKSGGDSDARREAISMLREALEICPSGHPDRARLLSETGKRFLDTNTPFFDLERGMAYISDGLSVDSAPVRQRLADACSDLRLVVDAYRYAVGKTDPPTRESINLRTLEIYAQAIRLLPRAASFALDHAARLRVIVGSDELSRNAAAHAVTLGRKEDAIEMLEEGRGTFWSQALHRRATGLDGILEEDRQALRTIFSTLEQSHSLNDGSVSFEHREDELENRRQLAVEADVIIHRIRTHPGFQRFLMPAAYDALMTSLPDGYIVMVISAKRGYHALLLNGGVSPGAKSIHLKRPSGRGGFLSDPIRATLPTNLRRSVQTLSQSQTFIAIEELRATHTDKVPETLEDTLQVFWTYIMKPIVQALGLKKATGRARPRVWWCMTGELSFLPVHAAGKYDESGRQVCASDFMVSSYVPTLSSLTKARTEWHSISCGGIQGLLVCEAAGHTGFKLLRKVREEIDIARACFEKASASVATSSSRHTSLAEMREMLEKNPHILHLACHGVQDRDPLKSAFILQDGRLSIEDIMKLDLPRAVMAYLSACETAKGHLDQPDQAVHLAASMLYCGFRSVIATMWSMSDQDGPTAATSVYRSLFESDYLDLDDIAYALDDAIGELRTSGAPSTRWAPFVHIGA